MKAYVVHHCKNTKLKPTKVGDKYIPHPDFCNNCFIDVDKTNVTFNPPTWKYCPEYEAKGFKNSKTRAGNMSDENKEKFKLRMAEYRRNKV